MFTSEMENGITWEQSLNEAKTDITGVVYGGDYDNSSEEEAAYTEGVQAAQWHFQSVIKALQKTYAPTIEMTKAEKDLFVGQMKVIEEEGKRVNNFEYFINMLTFSNELNDHALDRLLDEYETDSKRLMLAWLNPELIKVVD